MRDRWTRLAALFAALAVFAAGGAALAAGGGMDSSSVPPTSVGQGGQATEQTPAEPAGNEAASESSDTDNLQHGDQTIADLPGPSEEGQDAESASDGPGGYADTVPNANTHQEGEH
jgi:hypothetical protein